MKKIKFITILCFSTLALSNTSSYGAGFIYVKNLHKKCLSNYQDCVLECAQGDEQGCELDSGMVPETAVCARECMEEYNKCERDLNTLRRIFHHSPIIPPNVDAKIVPQGEEGSKNDKQDTSPSDNTTDNTSGADRSE